MQKARRYNCEIGSRIQLEQDTVLIILGINDDEVRFGIESPDRERQIADLPLRIVIPCAR